MNENIRDVTSSRPLTRVIIVTSSHSCDMTIFSTGMSCLWKQRGREEKNTFHVKNMKNAPPKRAHWKKQIITVAVRHLFSFLPPTKRPHLR